MLILDTNVFAELVKAKTYRDPKVALWIERFMSDGLGTTSITIFEMSYGTARMSDGKNREAALAANLRILGEVVGARILRFDAGSASHAGVLKAEREREGRPLGNDRDTIIAGIARWNGGTIVTRNVSDFRNCGVPVFDPWNA